MQYKTSKNLVECVLGIIFIIIIICPMTLPQSLATLVESPLGMIILLSITLLLFLYTNVFLALIFLILTYELIRKSSKLTGKTHFIEYTKTQAKKDEYIQSMNEPKIITLEEDMISKMAPLIQNDYIESTFKPVSDDNHNAFNI
jgi:hypothetical protein